VSHSCWHRGLRRIFRPLPRTLPQYDFFDIAGDTEAENDEDTKAEPAGEKLGAREQDGVEERAVEPAGEGAEVGEEEPEAVSEDVESGEEPEPEPELFPPGPLEAVRIVPRKSRLLPGASRKLHARAVDQAGRTIAEGVTYSFEILGGEGTLDAEGSRLLFRSSGTLGTVRLGVTAREGERMAQAEAEIEVVDKLRGENPEAGIPDPKRVFDAEGDWRSRVRGRLWEYNAAHPDYQTTAPSQKIHGRGFATSRTSSPRRSCFETTESLPMSGCLSAWSKC
jgi:hypothetical protein